MNPGLAPWAMQECRSKGLFYDTFKINVSVRTCFSECVVLAVVSTHTY